MVYVHFVYFKVLTDNFMKDKQVKEIEKAKRALLVTSFVLMQKVFEHKGLTQQQTVALETCSSSPIFLSKLRLA